MKKLLSYLLACCLLASILPTTAFALSDSGDNNSAEGAQLLTLGDTISGQIAPEEDVDYYHFVLTESGRVTLDITSYMQHYSLYIYDTAGAELWKTEGNECNSTVGFRQDIYSIDLESGTYYLKVNGHKPYADNATGNYSIQTSFTSANANETEPNNSVAEANIVSLGDTIRGLIGINDLYDFYQLTSPTSGCITLDITSYMQHYSLYIYDTAGTELWKTEGNEYNSTIGSREDIYSIDLESGTYYLKVNGHKPYADNATGNYSIQTSFTSANANEAETNNSVAEANIVSLGSTIRGLIGVNDRYDFYQFTLPESGRVTLNITSYMQYYCMFIYDTTGTELWYTDWNEYNATTGFREDTHSIDLESGTYYLKVTGDQVGWWGGVQYAPTGNYSIQTSFTSANANESEPNNSVAEANIVSLGSVNRGLIGINDRYDFYQFNMAEGGELTLNIVSYMQYYTLHIYDTTGTQLWYTDENEYNTTTGFRQDSHTIDLESGTYYLKVTGYRYGESYASTGTYTVALGGKDSLFAVTGVSITPTTRTLKVGESASLTYNITPANATNTAVIWSSSNQTIATASSDGVVTALNAGTATITATTEDGGFTASCVVTVLEENTVDGLPFQDVPQNAWYYEAIQWAVENGITNGTSATTFSPDATCTRGQIVTFLWRANGSPAPATSNNPFTDVPADQWYTDAVLWAVEKGITTGTSATTFSPDAPCTRGQVATFLWRSQGQPTSGGNNIFTDIAPGAYYYDAVLWAVENGITNGMGDGTFAPDAPCTRGQIVTFLYRAMEKPAEEPNQTRSLRRINRYDKDGTLKQETIFNYSANGVLINAVDRELDQTGSVVHEAVIPFTFDEKGRLTEIGWADSDYYSYPIASYVYNSKDQLISSSLAHGGGSDTTYEYDNQGRLVRKFNDDASAPITTEILFYYEDNSGTEITAKEITTSSWEGEGPTVEEKAYVYSFDGNGRVVAICGESDITTYRYEYWPLVIEEYVNSDAGYMYQELNYVDRMGESIWSIYLSSAISEEQTLDDGSLSKLNLNANSGTVTYEFIYDNSESTGTNSKILKYPISEEDCYVIYKNYYGCEMESDEYQVQVYRHGSGTKEALVFNIYRLNEFAGGFTWTNAFSVYVNTGICSLEFSDEFFQADDYYY